MRVKAGRTSRADESVVERLPEWGDRIRDHHPPPRRRVWLDIARDRTRTWADRGLKRPPRGRRRLGSPEQAVSTVLGIPPARVARDIAQCRDHHLPEELGQSLRAGLPPRFRRVQPPQGRWLELLESVYAVVIELRPDVVVETGVGIVGASTTFMAQALEDLGRGRLISIDPDRFRTLYGLGVGVGIPEHLRERVHLARGSSRDLLTSVLDREGPIQLFLHDGCHTYRTMRFEFEVAVAQVSLGGVILSDDVRNRAFDDFASDHGLNPVFVRYPPSEFGYVRVATHRPAAPEPGAEPR